MNAHLLRLLLLAEWRHHPWRHVVALGAVALGVALAWSVHLINQSALAEFTAAVRAANGDADLSLRGPALPEALFERAATDPAVALASPLLEVDTHLRGADGRRVAVQVIGLDVLRAAPLAPGLAPRAAQGEDRLVAFDPAVVFPNAAALAAAGPAASATEAATAGTTSPGPAGPAPAPALQLQAGPGFFGARVAGSVAAGGTPLVVMDLAGAQERFGALGRLTRVDIRLAPGADARALVQRLALPAGVRAESPSAAEQRVSNLSRAYRVNLTVLALVALFVGAFLVFSVVSLGVAQRTPQLALLGVLGLDARGRQRWVLAECAVLGTAGALLGLLLGTAMAAAALRLLAGDLGGGYFPGIVPRLQWSAPGAALFFALGLASALVGGLWPARSAARLPPAQARKGRGSAAASSSPKNR